MPRIGMRATARLNEHFRMLRQARVRHALVRLRILF